MAVLLVPSAALSQKKAAAAAPAVSEAARKAGMAAAPAVVQTLGLNCQVSDARLIGEDKKNKVSYYEVACQPGAMGFVVQSAAEGGAASSFSCIEANTPPAPDKPPSAPCLLPGNANPNSILQGMIDKTGVSCVPEKARGIGQTKTSTYIEVACQGGAGYVVTATAPFDAAKPAQTQNCLLYDDAETNIKCTLSDKAARLAVIDTLNKSANNNCAIKDRRFVGQSKDNATFFEVSCQDGKGYIYKTDTKGALAQSYECVKATAILGGCQLTDARQAMTDQAALYTRLAKSAGGNCDVEKYALFPAKPGEEDVEMACKDGSGVIGIFKPGGKGSMVVDCGRAPVAGFKCSLTKPESAYKNLTSDLKKFNYNSCEVSNTRLVGKTDKGTLLMEVACADKLKGYVIEYQAQPTVTAVQATGCAFAGSCKLPGNT
jgi:hypothetical protein